MVTSRTFPKYIYQGWSWKYFLVDKEKKLKRILSNEFHKKTVTFAQRQLFSDFKLHWKLYHPYLMQFDLLTFLYNTFIGIVFIRFCFCTFTADIFLLWKVAMNYGCNLKKVSFRNSLWNILKYSWHNLSWKSSMSVSLIQMSADKLKTSNVNEIQFEYDSWQKNYRSLLK